MCLYASETPFATNENYVSMCFNNTRFDFEKPIGSGEPQNLLHFIIFKRNK